jgi:hypothetical protein
LIFLRKESGLNGEVGRWCQKGFKLNRYYKYRGLNLVVFLVGVMLALSPAVIAKSGNHLKSATKILIATLKDRLGVEVRTVTPKEAEKYNLDTGQGMTIIWLEPGGTLGESGFELNDIILEVNGEPLDSLNRFVELVDSLKSNAHITLLVLDHRTGQTGYVQVVVR